MTVDEVTFRRILQEELGTKLDNGFQKFEDKLDHKLDGRFTQFEKKLDQKLDHRFNIFEKKLDQKLDRRFEQFEVKLDQKLEIKFATFFGQMTGYLDQQLGKRLTPMQTRLDSMSQELHGFLKRADDDDIEQAALTAQVERHEGWITELADNTGTKLRAA